MANPPADPPTGPSTGSTTATTSTSSTTSNTPPPPPPPTTSLTTTTTSSTTTSSSTTTTSSTTTSTTGTTGTTSGTTTTSAATSTTANTATVVTRPPTLTPTGPATTHPGVVTEISTAFVSQSSGGIGLTTPTSAASSGGSKGFFANTGAVAGVFSVAGLIVLAIVIAVVTNGIRRRRARKFDRELAAATLEAASAPQPVFLDDEDDEYGPGARGGYSGGGGDMSGGSGYGQYSDVSSHGTFGQPAMSVGSHGESYGMREMGGGQSMNHMHGVGPGEVFDPYAVGAAGGAAGAAGIGVARARSGRVAGDGGYAAALQDGAAPYAAFAVPGGAAPNASSRPGQTNLDILEAAGMGAHAAGAGALARGPSMSAQQYNSQYQPYPASQQQPGLHQRSPSASAEYANLDRSRSMVSHEGSGHGSGGSGGAGQYYPPYQPQQAEYQQPYQQYGQQPAYASAQQQYPSHAPSQPSNRYSVGEDEDDAYGGYVAEEDRPVAVAHGGDANAGEKVPNPFGGEAVDRERERYSSADEEEEPRRVLKVANE